MDIFEEFNKIIKENIVSGKTKFAICMFGRNGLLLKQLLNERYGIYEELIIDNELYLYNDKIISLSQLKDRQERKQLQFIITSNVKNFINELKDYVNIEQIYNPFQKEQDNSQINLHMKIGKYSYGPLVDTLRRGYPEIERIGAFCSFAPGTCAVWNHPTNLVTTHEFMYSGVNYKELNCKQANMTWESINKKCIIENDVWLGQNVILTNGVHVGNGVIAGAGSVITKDVPDYAVVAGNPARIIKYRFTPEQIQQLNEIKWWEWADEKIRECMNDFLDIDIFLSKHYEKN